MVMENNDLNDTDDLGDGDIGIELDKLEVPKKDTLPIPDKPAKDASSKKPDRIEIEIEPEAAPKKTSKLKIIAAAIVIGLTMVLILLWQLKIISFPLVSGSGKMSAAPAYHAIDPVITNLGPNKHVKVSLIIRNHAGLENRMSDIEPVIRDTILTFLTSPGIKKMADEGDFGRLKPYIKNQITNILQTDYNDTVVLKELKVY